jgi:hypothetical protein
MTQKGLQSKWNVDSYLNQRHVCTEKYDRTPCPKTILKRRSHHLRVSEKIEKWPVALGGINIETSLILTVRNLISLNSL